jgi:integrase
MPPGPKPSVRYWSSRKAYGCWIGPTQHILAKGSDDAPSGPTYLEALDKFRKLVAQDADKGTDDYLVSSLLNQYRKHLRDTRKSGVPGVFEVMARGFAETFGHLRVRDLKPYEVDAWLASQKQWNSTSRAHAITLILAAVSWARKKGYIASDPLAGRVERPQPVLRGREAALPPELLDLLIAEARKNKMRSQEFADFLWVLRLTGARPGELRHAQAFNFQKGSDGLGRIVFRWNATNGYIWKNARKTQRDRIIYLTRELTEYVEGLAAKHPTGPLFRTPRGAGWLPTSVGNKWRWLVKRPAVVKYCREHGIDPNGLKPYFLRHSFISHFLDATGDIYAVAMMCGTSVKMVSQRYGHPDADKLHEKFLAYHAQQRASPANDNQPAARQTTAAAAT